MLIDKHEQSSLCFLKLQEYGYVSLEAYTASSTMQAVKDRHVYIHYRFATVGGQRIVAFVMNNVMHLEG